MTDEESPADRVCQEARNPNTTMNQDLGPTESERFRGTMPKIARILQEFDEKSTNGLEVSPVMYDDPAFKREWDQAGGIAVHDDKNIKGFFGEYRFLSNFYPAPVEFEGLLYPSSENAYQAAKCAPNKRAQFQNCSAKESKKLWKTVGTIYTPAHWDSIKLGVMQRVVFDKFLRNEGVRSALLLTNGKFLEETNWWRDSFWGVDPKIGGLNNLGIILMATRAYFTALNINA